MRSQKKPRTRLFGLIALVALGLITGATAFSIAQAGRKEKAVDTPSDKRAAASLQARKLLAPESGVIKGATVERDRATGIVARVRGLVPVAGAKTPEQAAELFLRANAEQLGLSAKLGELRPERSVSSLTGHHVTYQQVLGGYPVLGGRVSVHTNRNLAVVLVNNGAIKIKVGLPAGRPGDPARAIATALKALRPEAPPTIPPAAAPVVFVQDETASLVWNVNVETVRPAGSWEILVSVATGEVVSMVNRARFVDGDGMVFNPNPVNTSGISAIADGNDADTNLLTNQRVAVKLKGLDGSGFLQGPFCTTAPTTQQPRANEPGLAYNYVRSDDRFEEVMCYYHIDTSQRHIQNLGFTNVNNRQQGMDVNGTTEDNAWYSPFTGNITMGTGGVDDAEDAHIIWHEYGHAIQDNQVPGFGASHEGGSMGEGFGDYWALTAFTGIGPRSPAWDVYVATWDAVSYNFGDPSFLRRVDGTKHYPEDMQGEVHADGEIWSACLWQIRGIVGAVRSDTMILESHFRLSPDASFEDGALAILAANADLYANADAEAILQVFVDRGILIDPRIGDLVVASVSTRAGADVALSATLTRRLNGAPVQGKDVAFTVDGTAVGSALSDAAGVAQVPFTVPANAIPGQMVVNADFAGDAELFASAGTGKLYVLEMSTISGVVTDSGVGMDAIPVVATAAGPSAASAPGRDIPDNDQTGIEDTVELPNGGSVGPVVVGVNITHTWIGDLEVALIHPDGTTVLLHNRTGDSADNIVTTYPTLTPPAESLDVLKGKPIAGVWKLRVRDLGPADTGRLVSWSLTVERETPLVANAVTGPDGSYTLTDLEPGVWNVAPDNGHSTFLPAVQAVTIPSSKAGVDFALNSFTIGGKVTIGPDPVPNVLVTLTSPTDREINVSDSPGTPIPDNNTTGIEAPIVVSDLGTVTSVSVRVNITHPYIADLEVSLIHPDGTRLRLHNRTGGSADNIITTYPDQTRPAESLSALIGKPTKGTWKLRVRDLNIADVGTLNSWGLRIAFAGFADRTAATAPDGTYAFEDCIGGTHTVKPTSGWIRFNPAEAIVVVGPHQNDVDFVALATPTTLAVLPAQGERGGNVDLQAVLQETGGAPVVGQPVQFQVAGTVVGSGMTDATGTATVAFAIPVNMPVGDKDVAADFAGSDPYLPASAMGVLNVKGAKVLLFGPDRSGPIGSTVDLRAHLVTEVGRVPIPGKTITFEVNGTAVGQADTSAAGRATLPFVVPGPAGDYPIAFAFAGDADYEPGTAGATLTALIAPTTMTMPDRAGSIGGSSVDLRAFLYGPGSTVLPNKTVEFSVEGTAVGTAVTSTAGRALLMYPVPDGNGEGARAIGASYAGDVGYAPSSASATLNVARAPVYVWPFARSIKQGSAAALRAYVRRLYDYQWLPNRPIGFAVEGTYVGTANTDGAGVARFTYDGAAALAPGTYGFTASFAGDAWVAPGSGAATFRVVP